MARAAGRKTGANAAGPTTTKAFERISSQIWKRAAQMAIVCCPPADRDSAGRKLARAVLRVQGKDPEVGDSQETDGLSSTFSDLDEEEKISRSIFSFSRVGKIGAKYLQKRLAELRTTVSHAA